MLILTAGCVICGVGWVRLPSVGPLAEDLNSHYAEISRDASYEPPDPRMTVSTNRPITTELGIFHLLDHLHHTANGDDGLPAWCLRLTAPVYFRVISHLINQSLAASHIPLQWKTAIIHPIAKIDQPKTPADYRSISILPVLSRLLERELVQVYMYVSFTKPPMDNLLADQYAFRPTGSTTSALISIFHNTTSVYWPATPTSPLYRWTSPGPLTPPDTHFLQLSSLF